MDKIIYLKHPVSVEDKRRWNADGFRIIDDRFKPADFEQGEPKREPVIKRKAKKHKH